MRVTLQVTENKIGKYVYHRLNIKKDISKKLGLKEDDELTIEILEINGIPTSLEKRLDNA